MTTSLPGRIAGGAVALALVLAPAFAQQPRTVAHLKQLNGNVLVSRESGLAAASEAQGLADGARVITTSDSGAIVVFDSGCEVRLGPNQRLEIDSAKACAALVPQSLGPAPPAVAVGLAPPDLLPAVALVSAFFVIRAADRLPVSPN